MHALINWAIVHRRTVLLVLALLLISGTVTYITIPKENNPSIDIPIFYVLLTHDGISPEDAERLLLRPVEAELKSLDGLEEMRSVAFQGGASITLEFGAGFDRQAALGELRQQLDIARAELPEETEEPIVEEVDPALRPILVITLSGKAPERALLEIGRSLRDRLASVPAIMEAELVGVREEQLEILIDPRRLEQYKLSEAELAAVITRNNRLVPAGSLAGSRGTFPVKVPGVFENVTDILELPLKTDNTRVIRVRDVADVRRSFVDAENVTRDLGQPAVAIEVRKQLGTSLIGAAEAAKAVVRESAKAWPDSVRYAFSNDQSQNTRRLLIDLQNNVLTAILLVVIVLVAVLGLRSASLVGFAVPGSFLTGILVIGLLGMSINTVVLFSLIMAVGLLVDGAIVVTEYADRLLSTGTGRSEAYVGAAKRMGWPIVASTATTLAAFLPLMFWPGIVGEYMKYLPVTLIAVLSASLFMALIFVPVLGSLVGRPSWKGSVALSNIENTERGNLNEISGLTGFYVKLMRRLVHHPRKIVLIASLALVLIFLLYGQLGKGTVFWPSTDPESVTIEIRTSGDLSIEQKDQIVREVEEIVLKSDELKSVYTRTGSDRSSDLIGRIDVTFKEWYLRERPSPELIAELRKKTGALPGIRVDILESSSGPDDNKPIELRVTSRMPADITDVVDEIEGFMASVGGIRDIEDNRTAAGIEWQLRIDHAKAALYGADVTSIGNFVQLVTNGLRLGEYRPDYADKELDIRVRFPPEHRNLGQLGRLRLATERGLLPLSEFVDIRAAQRVDSISRVDGARAVTVRASVNEDDYLVTERLTELHDWVDAQTFPPGTTIKFSGQDEDQREAFQFLVRAFFVALFMMAIILVTQFNSFYQALLILTAVVLSVGGVLLGLMIAARPFGIVMGGIGVITLAGIVVNNNIVLIDTFNVLRSSGLGVIEAALRTGAQRLRPVLLTTTTTILGLAPMVLRVNIDLLGREIKVGGPISQFWAQLATSVAGGLAFATFLTLIVTPCLLALSPPREALVPRITASRRAGAPA